MSLTLTYGINVRDIWLPNYEYEAIKQITRTNCNKLIYFSQHEPDLNPGFRFYLINESCKRKGIKLDFILGCRPHADKDLRLYDLENVNITYWDTFFLLESYYNICKYPISIENVDYSYHYLCMNNVPRNHRCKTIDLLCKENLLNFGAVSWLRTLNNFNWKCFHNQKMTLDQDKVNIELQYKLPTQYYSSFCQLVCETHIDDPIFITEKTAIPLILGKPFIVISSLGYHKFLQELGFELYTEIFDYSFDNNPLVDYRIQEAVSNIKNICQIPVYELKSLYKKIHEKIEHNKNRAREIIFDKNRYPALVTEVIDHYFVTGEKVDHRLIDLHLGLHGPNR